MKVWFYILSIVLLSVTIISCSHTPPNYCANELELLSVADSLPLIEIDCTCSYPDTFGCIDILSKLPYNTKNSSQKFRFRVTGSKEFTGYTSTSTFPRFYSRDNIHVFLNFNDNILFENEYLNNIDSISDKLFEEYLKDDVSSQAYIQLKWDKPSSPDSLLLILNEITTGYLEFIKEFSKSEFQQELCDLDSSQMMIIKREYPLVFDFSLPPPPPPPPHIFEENLKRSNEIL